MRDVSLTQEETERYRRHLVMPEVSLTGQKRLKASSVLCVGVGGLGSPLTLYLTAAGIGRLGLVDPDTVDLSNIQRQVLYGTPDIGRSKVEVARERLMSLNPHVEIITHRQRLTRENAWSLIKDYAIIADASDNFATRYLVNDACVLAGKPNVQASIFRFEGQLSVFDAARGPCYRCVFPAPPPPGQVPSCAEAGVLGVLPGIVGSLQAVEVLKLILGKGEPLIGRMALIDTLTFCFRDISIRKDPGCPVCGESPTIRELIDYEAFCGGRAEVTAEQVPSIEVERLRERLAAGDPFTLLDVREPHEAQIARIEGDVQIPLGQLPDRFQELDPDRECVVYCHIGIRSIHAVQLLRAAGFRKVHNLTGGIDAWSVRVDPSVPRY
jgi:adenylyltransferase/sulfurtransferase